MSQTGTHKTDEGVTDVGGLNGSAANGVNGAPPDDPNVNGVAEPPLVNISKGRFLSSSKCKKISLSIFWHFFTLITFKIDKQQNEQKPTTAETKPDVTKSTTMVNFLHILSKIK